MHAVATRRLGSAVALVALSLQACVQLPALTVGGISRLHIARGGSFAASAFAIGAALGWRARLEPEVGEPDSEPAFMELELSRSGPACAFASVCRWEDDARATALLRTSVAAKEDTP